jgi:hypothetical protein
MLETTIASWGALMALGALHGINPAMGWLFAVALGMQEGSGRAVWRSLLPLAAGHALAVAAAIALAAAAGLVLSPAHLRWLVAGALFGIGVFHLRRHRHPRFGGMRVGMRDLAIWSFLMASAHGAGLMALPFVPATAPVVAEAHAARPDPAAARPAHAHTAHARHAPATAAGAGSTGERWAGLVGTLVHTVGYLLATGAIAALVYYRLGLRLLQRAWLNLDVVWAASLIVTAVLIPLA